MNEPDRFAKSYGYSPVVAYEVQQKVIAAIANEGRRILHIERAFDIFNEEWNLSFWTEEININTMEWYLNQLGDA
jgi:hypothetical protein